MLDSLIKHQTYAYQTVHLRFLNHDYTEEDEKDEFKVFLFILFIFFSVIMVQKQHEQFGTHMLDVSNGDFIF